MDEKEWDEYAENYHDYIISPFVEEVRNPIFKDLENIKNSSDMVVADLGTGRGDCLPHLAEKFRKVYAIDFSERMLAKAKEKNRKHKNIIFRKADLRNLTELGLNLDVAIAVNSILHPYSADVDKSLLEVYNSLKAQGIFIGIFPAMEAVIYNGMLIYEREMEKTNDEKTALRNAKRIMERKKYNFITSVYEDGTERQKFYYRFELKKRLGEAGFKNIKIKKVLYPWGKCTGDHVDFEGKPEMWDWYVLGKK